MHSEVKEGDAEHLPFEQKSEFSESKTSQYLRSEHFGPGEQISVSNFAAFEFCYKGEQR